MTAFLRFWYDFIIGDDWRMVAGVAGCALLCALLVRSGVNGWWLMPIGTALTLALSVWRAARREAPQGNLSKKR